MARRGKHSPIGVDVGETAVRAAQVACIGGHYTIESVARCERAFPRESGLAAPGSGEPGALARADPGAPGRGLKPPSRDDAEWLTVLAGCLQRCLRQSAFHGRTATAALDAPDVEFHALELPEAILAGDPRGASMTHPTRGQAEAASVVSFEVQRLLTDPKEAVEIRHWTLPTTSASAPNTIGMAAPRTMLTQRLAAFERAGMRCTRVDAAAAALCRLGCVLGSFGTDEVWGVLDLGARQTRLVLCVDETPVLVRTAGPGGFEWTGRIADGLEISTRAAEVQKCAYGLARSPRGIRSTASGSTTARGFAPASGSTLAPARRPRAALTSAGKPVPVATTPDPGAPGESPSHTQPSRSDPQSALHNPQRVIGSILFGILRGDLNELASEVKRSYEYVLSCYPPRTASDLILLGGGAGMHNLPEFLSDALGIPVRRASDFVRGESSRLHCDDACAEAIDALGLAVGLSIGQE